MNTNPAKLALLAADSLRRAIAADRGVRLVLEERTKTTRVRW